jgi:hypothetical protein
MWCAVYRGKIPPTQRPPLKTKPEHFKPETEKPKPNSATPLNNRSTAKQEEQKKWAGKSAHAALVTAHCSAPQTPIQA